MDSKKSKKTDTPPKPSHQVIKVKRVTEGEKARAKGVKNG